MTQPKGVFARVIRRGVIDINPDTGRYEQKFGQGPYHAFQINEKVLVVWTQRNEDGVPMRIRCRGYHGLEQTLTPMQLDYESL